MANQLVGLPAYKEEIIKKITIFSTLFAFMLIGSSTLIAATTVYITSTKDTFISNKGRDTDKNFGSNRDIKVKIKNAEHQRGLIEWDLSVIPVGVTITDATVTMKSNKDNRHKVVTVNIYRVTTSWNELSVTWNNVSGGDYDGSSYGSIVADTNKALTTSSNIKSLVQEWINGTNNYGVILIGDGATQEEAKFFSQDKGDEPAPILHVTYGYDTDGDGVFDDIDIDDDNDGILDKLEGLVTENNPGFEEPIMSKNTWKLVDDSQVPFWHTTATDHKMEFWSDGFQNTPAYSGNQFVEINANQNASLYQDVTTVPGEVIEFSIAHRGRAGTDVASMSVGAPGNLSVLKTMSTDNSAWVVYKTTYTVPAGQTTTRISFDAVSSSNGQASYGNLLDAFELFRLSTDSDGDGVANRIDLDSDNDGIPDNVEAQSSKAYIAPSGGGTNMDDSNNNGLDDNYDPIANGVAIVLIDTDGDGIYDHLDADSDEDLITDCNESLDIGTNRICPVNNANVGINGLVNWAEINDDYSEVSGIVSDPLTDLEDEISSNDEAAYREAGCGPAESSLIAMQWKTISFPCNTGTNGVEALLGDSLGVYGDSNDWVMYKQESSYTGNPTSDFTLMNAGDTVRPGQGYWIISATSKLAKIKKPLAGIMQTTTEEGNNYAGLPNSYRVMPYVLPTSSTTDYRKVLIGNPFFKKFQLSDMYYKNASHDPKYVSMASLSSGDTMEPVVYVKDSSDTSAGNYMAITPTTPGLTDPVPTMQGFWIKLNAGNADTNSITYPLEK